MLPNLSGLSLGEPTGEFYALTWDEYRERREENKQGNRCPVCLESLHADAHPEDEPDDATFRLPLPDDAPKNADGSYKYRVYNAKALWEWVREPGRETDPIDRTRLLRSDWEALRDQYSDAATHPTPSDRVFRRPIGHNPYLPPPPPPPPPPTLTYDTLTEFVRTTILLHNLDDLTVRSIVRMLERDQGKQEGAFWPYRRAVSAEVDFWLPLALLFRANVGIHDRRGLGIFEFPPPLRDDTIKAAVRVAYAQGGPHYNHPTYGPIAGWAVHEVTNMDGLFGGPRGTYRNFNPDLSRWDVRRVTSMENLFWNADAFNADLSRWFVFHVANMNRMFRGATAFEGKGLDRWAVNRATSMNRMFQSCEAFNADLSLWNVNNVTDMKAMFAQTTAFEGKGLDRWDVRNVTNMSAMFYQATGFNADLSRWDVRNVTNMDDMFYGADSYNPEHPIGSRRGLPRRRVIVDDDSDDEPSAPPNRV